MYPHLNLPRFIGAGDVTGSSGQPDVSGPSDATLLEDGDLILLESGDYLLME